MDGRQDSWRLFWRGLISGALSALLVIFTGYAFILLGLIPVPSLPSIQQLLSWIYDNLRLSIIPFALALVLYFWALAKLKTLLNETNRTHSPGADLDVRSSPEGKARIIPEQIVQAENWVNIAISLFFGIGVIWTAIGLRSALVQGLSDLDSATAAAIGSFEILRRLVEGGILLALSTTIVGAIGGYLMRLNKIMVVGAKLQNFYEDQARSQTEALEQQLQKIESYLAQLAARSEQKQMARQEDEP